MKQKNGFVFTETIIVLTVVAIGLIMLYSIFSRVLRREKAREFYNQPVDIYHLYTMKDYLKHLEPAFIGGKITPTGPASGMRSINLGSNSWYFRLECQCNEQFKKAIWDKYGFIYCEDTLMRDTTTQTLSYANFCADLNNHLKIRDVYIVKNTVDGIKSALFAMQEDEKQIEELGKLSFGGRDFEVMKYKSTSNIKGIARKVNASLIDYMKTISPFQSEVAGEDWSNDYIIIGEFYRDGKYSYASLRYEG